MIYLYGLLDPDTFILRYIGLTNNTDRRYKEHISTKPRKDYKSNWVQSLKTQGKVPILAILANFNTYEEAFLGEGTWIQAAKDSGLPVVNYWVPGLGGAVAPRTPEWCEAISKSKSGKSRAAQSAASIEKTAAAHRGMKRSEESRRRMSEAQKANKKNIEKLIERNKTKLAVRVVSAEERIRRAETMRKVRQSRFWSSKKVAAQ